MKNQCIEKDLSLMGLLEDNKQRKGFSIEIPALQRDYAQGRWAQKEIGKGFVNALIEALDGGDKAKGLHLDFIYGYVEGQDSKKLILIDGQQRLTTLWLLHLYLYKRTGKVDAKAKDWLGRFSYVARSSAKEFCQALLEQDFLDSEAKKPSDLIYDKSPLFGGMRLLRHDPTIAAMLNMLDWIHEGAKNKNPDELVNKLGGITFDFFDMKQFELGEELYIKMNARGKPLSEYENLKALIEKKLKEEPKNEEDQEDVARLLERIDAEWSDYFYSDDSNSGLKDRAKLFDARGKNFLYHSALFFGLLEHKDEVTEEENSQNKTKANKVIDKIKSGGILGISERIGDYEKLKQLDRALRLFRLFCSNPDVKSGLGSESLDFLASPSFFGVLPKLNNKKGEVKSMTHKEQCYLFAILAYCREESGFLIGCGSNCKELLRYLRVARHLIENHEAENFYLLKFARCIEELSKGLNGNGIYTSMSDDKAPIARMKFYKDILQLEVRKAKLIKSDDGRQWEEILNKVGRHPLLRGRVDFLLDFSDEDFDAKHKEYRQNLECKKRGQKVQKPTYTPNLQRFEGYVDVAMKLLDRDFLSKNLPLLQRAWLCMGDFGVYIDKHIYCGHYDAGFYEGDAFSARHNWHLLLSGKFKGRELQKPYFKKLLENLNEYDNREALCKRLQKIIKDFGLKQKAWWMQLLIKQKEHFKFLHDRVGIPQSNATRIRKIDGQEHKIELLPTKGCIENGKVEIRDVLGYGFYLYCQKRGILKQNESYTKEERPFYSGGIVPCFKINGKEVFCNSLKKPRKRKDGKGQIDEECIVIGDKPYPINLDGENDIFAEFEKVLKGAKDAGLLLNEATKI